MVIKRVHGSRPGSTVKLVEFNQNERINLKMNINRLFSVKLAPVYKYKLVYVKIQPQSPSLAIMALEHTYLRLIT